MRPSRRFSHRAMNISTLKRGITLAVRRVAPPVFAAYERWWLAGYARARKAIVARYGTVVQAGPFAGMRFAEFPFSPIPPMILGTYERELHAVIEAVIARGYDTVVNVGCAEGYYAVGLARRMPTVQVHAFELVDETRRICEVTARLNNVDARVSLSGAANAGDVASALRGRSLVVCDCEGDEREVLRPDAAPSLFDADLLVEVHDHKDREISRLLRAWFGATHDIRAIHPVPRRSRDHPEVHFLTPRARHYALLETRGAGLHWLFMTARQR
jgi:hypothetical protein